MIGINPSDPPRAINEQVNLSEVEFAILQDPAGKYFSKVAAETLPRVYLLDADGKIIKNEHGKTVFAPGRFEEVKGVGWYIDEYKMAQISMNLTNYKITPAHEVLDAAREEAEKRGFYLTGSEVVGLIPFDAADGEPMGIAQSHRAPVR